MINAWGLAAAGTGAFLLAALATALPRARGRHASKFIAYTGAGFCAVAGAVGIVRPSGWSVQAQIQLLRFEFRVDGLSAVGLLALALVSISVIAYASQYLQLNPRYSARQVQSLLNVLFASIVLVLTSAHAIAFLIAWETMGLAGYFLVIAQAPDAPEAERATRAGLTYFVMAHLGGAFLFVAFASLHALTGSYSFSAYDHLATTQSGSPLLHAAFVAASIGFAAKAGLIPLHGWLPLAYAEAPAAASAAMSGIMSKTAVFLMARFLFQFLGAGPTWWGLAIMILGLASAVLGILYALQEDDLKRLLAFSSIENLGIIFVDLGLAAIGLSENLPTLALVAGTAALFHTVNHAAFKSLLFLTAGLAETAAGTRNLNHLGGLARTMPWTAALFFVGAVAISALPPLNGFVSEWLTYQAAVGLFAAGLPLAGVGAAVIALLALAGGIAVATFVKAQGTTFHALARSQGAAAAKEVPHGLLVGPAALATACIALALFAPQVQEALAGAIRSSAPTLATTALATSHFVIGAPGGTSAGAIAPVALVICFLAISTTAYLGTRPRRAIGGTAIRRGPVWACGYETSNARATYSGAAIAKPIRMMFSGILLPARSLHRASPLNAARSVPRFESELKDPTTRFLYGPAMQAIQGTSEWLRVVQRGSVRVYLAYILCVLVALIVYVAVIA